MADELKITVTSSGIKGSFSDKRSYGTLKADLATGGSGPGTQSIATSETTVDMTGFEYVIIQNLDAANYVQWGFATGVYKGRLKKAGAPPTIVDLEAGTTLYLLANTAACQVDFKGFK